MHSGVVGATLSLYSSKFYCARAGIFLFPTASIPSFTQFFLLKRDSKSLRYLCAPFTQSFSIDALPQFMCTPKNCFKKAIIWLKRDNKSLRYLCAQFTQHGPLARINIYSKKTPANSLHNMNYTNTNFTNMQFQRIPEPDLTSTFKKKVLH